ncbi:MAG: sigma 54-interacting transcriptional regulator [Desulfobacteraceae bacterium]
MIDDMDFFHQATLRICGTLEIEKVASRCFEYLRDFVPLDGIMLNIFDLENCLTDNLAMVTRLNINKNAFPISTPPETRDFLERQSDRVRILGSRDGNPVSRAVYTALGMKSVSSLVLDLKLDEKTLGVVVLFAKGPNRYQSRQTRLLKLLHDPFAMAMANTLQHHEVVRLKNMMFSHNRYLRRKLSRFLNEEIVGAKYGLRNVMEMVAQVAPLDSQVLLLGETGVGKDVIANAIHRASPRKDGPYIKVNCGAIPESLIDSELFGHEKGAFTGASSQKPGRFERAHQGTLFLDEIGELPRHAQVRLLRVLQDKEIERVGGTRSEKVDVRVIAATHRNMEKRVQTGQFREDLWFRINVFPITIPPVRKRKCDILALVNYFVERKANELHIQCNRHLAPGALERLQAYDWPGNVRELQNVVERALILNQASNPDQPLAFEEISGKLREAAETGYSPKGPTGTPPLTLNEAMRRHIQHVLDMTHGKIQGRNGAANLLSIHPNTLRNRMQKLGMSFGGQRRV